MKCCKAMVLLLGTTFLFLPAISFAQMTWTCATDSADWLGRAGHASVEFDGKMWVLGGRFDTLSTDSLLNDVWWSTDGMDWTMATNSADWSPRMLHGAVVFHDTMWVIGGWGVGTVMLNDVWFSTDGANWTCATASAPWTGRGAFGAVVYNDEMWVIGGYIHSGAYYVRDVWSSPDGVNWTCVTASADWSGRSNLTATNFDGQIWVVAGYAWGGYRRDVWYSTDGSSWFCATNTAEWSSRSHHCTIAFDNKMWVIGGGTSAVSRNDVWYSTDGADWYCATDSAEWCGRRSHSAVVFDNKMWVIGGGSPDVIGVYLNDVWYSTGLGTEEQPIFKPIESGKVITATIFHGPLQLPKGKQYKVFDITGRVVEPSKIQPGIYFVEIDGEVVQKVVRIR